MAVNMTFHTDDLDQFKRRALYWADRLESVCYFDSNAYQDSYSAFDVLIGAGVAEEVVGREGTCFEQLQEFLDEKPSFAAGYLSYDLKNELEVLKSENPDHLEFPLLYFFRPLHILRIAGNRVEINSKDPEKVWSEIHNQQLPDTLRTEKSGPVEIRARFSREEYIDTVEQIQKHIQRGDIYEMNLCQEFYARDCDINPVDTFLSLNQHSPTPFASYFKVNERYILSASPERFLSRRGTKLISQPIKGTSSRSADLRLDEERKKSLQSDEKERAENVMIVDLVRNDLTKVAVPGSVSVEELFGVYSFKQVHQLISTIVCEVAKDVSNPDIIKHTFPMGSMTGAPKISAMKLAERYEKSRRGVFSGAAGYFDASGDFDLNVVIRTILYNSARKYLSYQTGGAITLDSIPSKEFEECMLKGSAIREVLEQKNTR